MRSFIEEWTSISGSTSSFDVTWDNAAYGFSATSVVYSMVICAVIPILVIYPFIQKYFAKGVNMGGVKE
jgi:ABC-type glycerol-3-phosphate transport system permease component